MNLIFDILPTIRDKALYLHKSRTFQITVYHTTNSNINSLLNNPRKEKEGWGVGECF